jgi:NAD(P)H-dependent flavin oxidoreductase YrpB (nitropropane dioxygenase family)
MLLGAAGVNLGSRFLASAESPVGPRWKHALSARPSEDWVQARFINVLNPVPGTVGYRTRLRLLRTDFVERWEPRAGDLAADPTPALAEIATADAAGDREDLLVVGGQSAGLIRGVQPAGDIVRALIAEARDALAAAAGLEL